MQRPARTAFLLLAVLLVAACGGGSTTASGGDPVDGSAEAPAATQATETSEAPPAEPGTGSSGASGPPCDLATADELTGALGIPVTTLFDPVAATTCFVKTDDGRTVAHWTLAADGPFLFDSLTAGGTPVSGLGDRASHVENLGLMIVKGDTAVTIVIASEANLDADQARDAAEKIGAIVVGRM